MTAEHQLDEDSLGVVLPEEMVAKFGLKEGDVFELVANASGMVLYPVSEAVAAQMSAAGLSRETYNVTVQDLAKLPMA